MSINLDFVNTTGYGGALDYLGAEAKVIQKQYPYGLPSLSSQNPDDAFGKAVNVTLSEQAQAAAANQNESSKTTATGGIASVSIPRDVPLDVILPSPIQTNPLPFSDAKLPPSDNPNVSPTQQAFIAQENTQEQPSSPSSTTIKPIPNSSPNTKIIDGVTYYEFTTVTATQQTEWLTFEQYLQAMGSVQ